MKKSLLLPSLATLLMLPVTAWAAHAGSLKVNDNNELGSAKITYTVPGMSTPFVFTSMKGDGNCYYYTDGDRKYLLMRNANISSIHTTKSLTDLVVIPEGTNNVISCSGSSCIGIENGDVTILGNGTATSKLTIRQTGKYKGMYSTKGGITIRNVTINVSTRNNDSFSQEGSSKRLVFDKANVNFSGKIYAKNIFTQSCGFVSSGQVKFAQNTVTDASGKALTSGTIAASGQYYCLDSSTSSSSNTGNAQGSASEKWTKRVLSNDNMVFSKGNVSFTMVWVKAGAFIMGGNKNKDKNVADNERPAHQVTLTTGFYISETEVTQEVWRAVMNEDPTFPGLHLNERVAPKLLVKYDDAIRFVRQLSAVTGETFNLPTEARWEFAARGGTKSRGCIYAGSDKVDDVAWIKYNSVVGASAQPHAVKTKSPNELGIYDMSGNAWEWCLDSYSTYKPAAVTNPCVQGGSSQYVRRGGSCYSDIVPARVSARQGCSGNEGCGVRIVMELQIDLL